MDFVYKNGVVLCDIKPQNVLLAPDETGLLVAKIADFGLAKSTFNDLEIGVRGTAMYLAPASIVDEIQLHPSDVWALGCVVLNMLTRRPTWKLNLDEGIRKPLDADCLGNTQYPRWDLTSGQRLLA